MRFLVLLALLLAACGDNTVVMRKPGAGQDAEWRKDSYDCMKDAYATGDMPMDRYGIQRDPNMGMYQSCMEARGYQRRN